MGTLLVGCTPGLRFRFKGGYRSPKSHCNGEVLSLRGAEAPLLSRRAFSSVAGEGARATYDCSVVVLHFRGNARPK